jgi:hypothetical protein
MGVFKADIQIPLMPNGSYPVTASDGMIEATAQFTILPKITVSPQTSGPPGTFVMVTGSGFSPSTNITVKFASFTVTNYWGVQTWIDGSFGIWMVSPAMFFVPDVPNGRYIINATDETGLSAVAPFTVPSPTLAVTPNVTSGSSYVTVSGLGFSPREPILVYFEGTLMVDLLDLLTGSQALYTDEFGAYEYSFVVPITTPGVYTITAHKLVDPIDFTPGDELAATELTVTNDSLLLDIHSSLLETNAELLNINGTLATINSTLGLIKLETSNIGLEIFEINGQITTMFTTLSALEGNISSIDGNTITILTDLGTVKARVYTVGDDIDLIEEDIEGIKEDIDAISGSEPTLIPIYIVALLSLISAVGTTILTAMHVQVLRRSKPQPK